MTVKLKVGLSILAILVVFTPMAALGQDTLRVDVELVNVVVTVTDADGHYVAGLNLDDFVITDAGVPHNVAHFAQDNDIPLSLGIVLDTSASMLKRIDTALAAVERFVGTLHEDDDVFFMTFADRVSLVQDLTRDRRRLSRALLEVRPWGGTSLYDAMVRSLEIVAGGRHDKQAILVLTDGTDTSSEFDLGDALDAVEATEVLVYGLGIDAMRFGDPEEHVRFDWPGNVLPGAANLLQRPLREGPVDMDVLEDFAEASGGQTFRVTRTWEGGRADDIDQVLDEVSAELRNQYSLGYYPTQPGDGLFHKIQVHIRDHDDYSVRTRAGYTAIP
jgi:VWFA-related protein